MLHAQVWCYVGRHTAVDKAGTPHPLTPVHTDGHMALTIAKWPVCWVRKHR